MGGGKKLMFFGKGPLKKGVLALEKGGVVEAGGTFNPDEVDKGVLKDLLAQKVVGDIPKKKAQPEGGK